MAVVIWSAPNNSTGYILRVNIALRGYILRVNIALRDMVRDVGGRGGYAKEQKEVCTSVKKRQNPKC